MKQYTVRILPEDCKGDYHNPKGCGLYKAIERQLPSFPLLSAGAWFVRDLDNNIWYFDERSMEWDRRMMINLKTGTTPHFDVTFSLKTD